MSVVKGYQGIMQDSPIPYYGIVDRIDLILPKC